MTSQAASWAKQFASAEDFVAAITPGRGFKTATHVYAHMDRHTAGRLDRDVKAKLAHESRWWMLSEVPVSRLKTTHVDTMRKDPGDVDLTIPLVLGNDLRVLDGRHRAKLAKESDLQTIKAWVPAAAFYQLSINPRERKASPRPERLFHITYARNLPGIAKEGLVPGRPSLHASGIAHHLRGAIFLTSPDGVSFWYSNSEEAMVHVSDDPQSEGYTPVVLRVLKPGRGCEQDELGSDDANAPAFRCKAEIPVSKIEVWSGSKWLPISQYARLDISSAYEEDGYFSDEHPLLPEWRGMEQNPSSAISTCQELWEHYCERPGKTRLRAVLAHLEAMKESKSIKVKAERRRCLRAARAEARELGVEV